MKFKLYFFLIALCFSVTAVRSQVMVTATGGVPSGSYTSLNLAFTAINGGLHTGNIDIELTANSTLTASALLDSSGNATASSYGHVYIHPSSGTAVTVSGSVAGPLLNFSGADSVKIDGINAGGASLTFSNTNTAGNTLRFIYDATFDTVRNTTIKGATISTTSGIIQFSTGVQYGNDNNLIENCNVDGTLAAYCCLFSLGSTTSSALENSNNTIQNNNFYDNFPASVASPVGLFLNSGNTGWLIKGNSFYLTTPITTAVQGLYTGMIIYPYYVTDTHVVEYNYVGGSSPGAVGTMSMSATSTNVVGFNGLYIQTGGTGNVVRYNIVKNVALSYSSNLGSFSNFGFGAFIGGYSGSTSILNNTVSKISLTNNNGTILFYGFNPEARVTSVGTNITPAITLKGNLVDSISGFAAGTSTAVQLSGIRLLTSNSASLSATAICTPSFVVDSNSVSNMVTNYAAASTLVRGIVSFVTANTAAGPLRPKFTISNNNIFNLSSAGTLASYSGPTAGGVFLTGANVSANATDTSKVFGNNIYNLSATNTTDVATTATGIVAYNGRYVISKNRIYNFHNQSSGVTTRPGIVGVNLFFPLVTTNEISNNYIALGQSETSNTQFFGITNTASAATGINIYNNTVYIGGAGNTANTLRSSCVHRGSDTFTTATTFTTVTTPFNLKNNLLVNSRTGGTGGHYAVSSINTANWVSNYNALVSSAAATTGFWGTASQSFTGLKAASAMDSSSVSAVTGAATDFSTVPSVLSTADLFANASPGTTGILDIKTTNAVSWLVNGRGTSTSNISTDVLGNTRSLATGVPTDIGAHEFSTATLPADAVASAAPALGTTTAYSYAGKKLAEITWGATGTVPSAIAFKYYPGMPPGNGTNTYSTISSYADVQATGGSGYTYAMKLYYTDAEANNQPDATMTVIKKTGTAPFGYYASTTGSDADGKFATAPNFTSFSLFSLFNNTLPLDIKLLRFAGENNGAINNLHWNTAKEDNGDRFQLQRSADGKEFVTLTEMDANGKASDYHFADRAPFTGINYYRLKMMDVNGTYAYSNTVTLFVKKGNNFAIQAFPNPAKDYVIVKSYGGNGENATIELADLSGRVVMSQNAHTDETRIELSNLSVGMYFLRYTRNNQVEIVKITKQ